MRRYSVIVGLGVTAAWGCVEVSAPPGSRIHVEPLVPLRTIGIRGGTVTSLPAVRVINIGDGTPVAGKEFTFTLESPVGEIVIIPVKAGNDGIARLPSWTLGDSLGRYRATAATEDWWAVNFQVFVPGAVAAIYDLTTVNGMPVPTARASESHLVLYESGFVNWFSSMRDTEFTPDERHLGTYRRTSPEQVDFELECGATHLQRCARWGLTAAVRGSELVIDKTDDGIFGDWIEVYTLRPATGASR